MEKIENFYITPAHIRAARAWLNWTLDDTVTHTGYNRDTISRIERGAQPFSAKAQASFAETFRRHGVIFTENGIEARK